MIAVIDYGLGNLRSVNKAIESIGAKAELTNNSRVISRAKAAVLPGVGAFYKGMENLNKLGLVLCIKEFISSGKPFLGICLGLQLLFSESKEHGRHKGLDVIKGKVRRFEGNLKIPHMGWNTVKSKIKNQKSKILKGIPDNSYFYFVHSYFVEPDEEGFVTGTTKYGKIFCSVIEKNNVFGVQFHPEKSSEMGIKILKNFIDICQRT